MAQRLGPVATEKLSLELSREHGYGAFKPRAAAILEAPISAGT